MNNSKVISQLILDHALSTGAEVFGQNLLKPSYIAGLGQCLVEDDGHTPKLKSFFDLPNQELTTIGYGIGRAIGGKHSICIVKQQDFLFLAIDQLINTVGNLHDKDRPKGSFTIICLVSDVPFEGTQAYSNNMAIFENCNAELNVYHCMNVATLNQCFKDSENEWLRLIFLSSDHIYKSSVTNEENHHLLSPGIFVTEHCHDELAIIIGLIENRHLSKISNSDMMFIYKSFNEQMAKTIADTVSSRGYKKLSLIDGSSSATSSAFNCYYHLKETESLTVPIDIIRLRGINNENLALRKQGEENDIMK